MNSKKLGMLYAVSLSGPSNLKGAIEISENILSLAGVNHKNLARSDNGYIFSISAYLRSKHKAQVIKKKLLGFKLKKISVKLRTISPKDWRDKWKEKFHAFPLTKSIDIVPVWEKVKYKNN